LAAFAARAYNQPIYEGNFASRLRFLWLQAGHDIAVKQRTKKRVDEHFSFDVAPLSGTENDDLKSIALTIFYTAAFLVGRPRMGLSFLFRGQLPAPPMGEFWSGRPHIHLVRFRGQCRTASENEQLHGSDFGRILARAFELDGDSAKGGLPSDARLMQDYNAYVMRSCSLWVWSAEGLSQQALLLDRNRGNLIYERQAVAELLEYGYMLHRSLYHRVEEFSTSAEVMAVRKQVLQLRRKMHEASQAGEIVRLLESGWMQFGLPDLVSEIESGLRLRESEVRSTEARRSERVSWSLAVVFGLVAVPTLAEQVIKPAWKLMRFHQYADSSTATLVFDGVAVGMVLLFLCAVLLVTSARRV
jgi:hypothetical protein